MRRHIACERGHRVSLLWSVWLFIGSPCSQPQIVKASQCIFCPSTKFIMARIKMFNLDNKQTGGSPSKLATKIAIELRCACPAWAH